MRAYLYATLAALAVFFTASVASAQTGVGCLSRSLQMVPTATFSVALSHGAKPPAKDASTMASRDVDRVHRTVALRPAQPVPNQSRIPILCTDPNTPGCHIDAPEAPHHHSMGMLAWEAAFAETLFGGIPPAEGIACADTPYTGCAREGHGPSTWRPPSA